MCERVAEKLFRLFFPHFFFFFFLPIDFELQANWAATIILSARMQWSRRKKLGKICIVVKIVILNESRQPQRYSRTHSDVFDLKNVGAENLHVDGEHVACVCVCSLFSNKAKVECTRRLTKHVVIHQPRKRKNADKNRLFRRVCCRVRVHSMENTNVLVFPCLFRGRKYTESEPASEWAFRSTFAFDKVE